MSKRRARGGPGIVTIFWRDIPAQVTAIAEDGSKEQVLLHDRFQHAIDRAAAVAGLTQTDDYVNEWRRVVTTPDGDPVAASRVLAAAFENDIPPERLEALVVNGGLGPDSPGESQ
jgi:hypothetical protein